MKKIVFCFVAVIAMVASVSVFANSHHEESAEQHHDWNTHVHMEGKHCRGTVGCDCPGFRPITNGDVWQQSYCYYCGHRKGLHK